VTVILHALLLEIPEKLESERLTLASARAGQGAAVNAEGVRRHSRRDAAGGLADSCMYARVF
jgi:hypothetical protein